MATATVTVLFTDLVGSTALLSRVGEAAAEELLYIDTAWAASLADRDRDGDRTRARSLAERALNAATAGGYGYIEADARAVLDRL